MGRHFTVKSDIYEDEDELDSDGCQRYGPAGQAFGRWSFMQGHLTPLDADGPIDVLVKDLLETAKKYGLVISGALSYNEDSGGGSTYGIVYVAKDYSAVIFNFNTDVNLKTLDDLLFPMSKRFIRIV